METRDGALSSKVTSHGNSSSTGAQELAAEWQVGDFCQLEDQRAAGSIQYGKTFGFMRRTTARGAYIRPPRMRGLVLWERGLLMQDIAAVLAARPRRQRLMGELRAAARVYVKELYEGGMGIRAVCAAPGGRGLSYGVAHNLLKEAGVTFRPRGGARQRARSVAAEAGG